MCLFENSTWKRPVHEKKNPLGKEMLVLCPYKPIFLVILGLQVLNVPIFVMPEGY